MADEAKSNGTLPGTPDKSVPVPVHVFDEHSDVPESKPQRSAEPMGVARRTSGASGAASVSRSRPTSGADRSAGGGGGDGSAATATVSLQSAGPTPRHRAMLGGTPTAGADGVGAGGLADRARRRSSSSRVDPKKSQQAFDRLNASGSKRISTKHTSEQLLQRRTNTLKDIDDAVPDSFTTVNLRKLFRVFDVDNNKKLKHDEFQSGLLALNYANAQDPVVVSNFLKEIDADKTGFVTEDEFITYFQSVNRREIKKKLEKFAKQSTLSCSVVDYSAFHGDYVVTELPDEAAFVEYVSALKSDEFAAKEKFACKRWFDVCGYSTLAMEMLSSTFGVHPETVKDAAIFQQAKIETLHASDVTSAGTDVSQMRGQLLLHMLTMINQPLQAPAEGAGPPELVSKEVLTASPPDFSFEQVSIIVVDEHTMISIRPSETMETDHPCAHVFTTLHNRVADYSAMSALHSSSVKLMAFELADAILQHNYEIRDTLKDWQVALERSIRVRTQAHHTQHLYTLGKLADAFNRHLESLKADLSHAEFSTSLNALFFSEQDILFRELHDDVVTITSDVEGITEMCDKLNQLYQRLQADQMSRVLYLLTVVTAVFIPAQFLTGLWGMNFSNMPELTMDGGYIMFWCIVLVLCGAVLALFRIFNLFAV